MFLNQYLFEIVVGEQSDSYQCCGMFACTDEKKTKDTSQHITDWYSKKCGIITVLSRVLTQHRTTDKGETSHDKNKVPNIHIFLAMQLHFSHFCVCTFTFPL